MNMGLQKFNKNNVIFDMKLLNDICKKIVDGPFGSDVLENDYVDYGIPFIRVQNVSHKGFDKNNLIFISKKANENIKRSECQPGDVVVTKTGRLGTTCVLPEDYDTYNIRGDLAKLELKDNIDAYFVMSYLNSDFGNKIVNSYSSGSTRGRVLISNLKKVIIPIPSPEIQKYIGDKVRKAEELKEEAKRLKKEAEEILNKELNLTFISEKLKGGPRKFAWYNSILIDDRIDANLYIIQMNIGLQEFNKNNINFDIKMLNDICEKIVDGPFGSAILGSDYADNGIPFIRVQNVTPNGFDETNLTFISIKANNKIMRSECKPGDVVITKTGRLGTACVLTETYNTYNIRGDLAKLELNANIDPYFVMLYLNSDFGNRLVNSYSSGSTRGRVLISNLKKIIIPIPSPEIQKHIGDKVRLSEKLSEEVKQLLSEAKQDVESLIEGTFDMDRLKSKSR
jgi:restriction endonuclease S subunit